MFVGQLTIRNRAYQTPPSDWTAHYERNLKMLLFALKKADLRLFSVGGTLTVKINGVERHLTCDGEWIEFYSEEGRQRRRVLAVSDDGDYVHFACAGQDGSGVVVAPDNEATPNYVGSDIHRETQETATKLRDLFFVVATAFAERSLPEDDGNWDMTGPSDGQWSLADILHYYEGSGEIMPPAAASLLGLPVGATYSEGARRIWTDPSGRNVRDQTQCGLVQWQELGF
jgi:hypothetical protein